MSTKPNTNLTLTVEVDNGEHFDGVQFHYFHYNFTVTGNALRKVEPRPLHTDTGQEADTAT